MATLKSFLETAIAKVSMRKLTTFGTGVDISSAISKTSWVDPNYYPPSDGVIKFQSIGYAEAYLGDTEWVQWEVSLDSTAGRYLVIPVQKGVGVSIWVSSPTGISGQPLFAVATFYPFA